MKFQQLQSPVRKLFPGQSFQESDISEPSVTGRCEFVPVRLNKFSRAGVITVTSGCGVGENEASWPLKASFFTETPLIITWEHMTTIKISLSSSVHWLWYLNKTPTKNDLKFNFPHEKGKCESHIKHSTPSYSPTWTDKEKWCAWGMPCSFIRVRPSTYLKNKVEIYPQYLPPNAF